MRKLLLAIALPAVLSCARPGTTIGVSMALFDDNFLTTLRNGMQDYARTLEAVNLQIEDAQNDVAKQLSQIQNFISQGVDAIIVNPVDTDATPAMTRLAVQAGIPIIYLNRQPADLDELPRTAAFVGSNEVESGTLATREVCRLLKQTGKGAAARILVMMGELSNQAARQRTQDVHDVIGTPECSFMKIVEQQTANWQRTQGQDLMTNWISGGAAFDAIVSNNDEMAIGAIQALKAAGYDLATLIVAGIDGTQDALAAMKAGDLDVTVFQDAAGQGKGAVGTALRLAQGDTAARTVWIPFELVTPANMDRYLTRN
ncbi:MAG TPA: sugar ABC transporter substrate-binding protein [Gemmatimonadales bacterium]|nr:sugar ABC transporter substrate-binding protein [Gemmatimonadales bacterium]